MATSTELFARLIVGRQLFDRTKFGREVPQHFGLPDNFVAPDAVGALFDLIERCRDHVEVALGVDAPRDGEPSELQRCLLGGASLGVAIHQIRTDIAATDTGFDIQLNRQRLTRELMPRYLW